MWACYKAKKLFYKNKFDLLVIFLFKTEKRSILLFNVLKKFIFSHFIPKFSILLKTNTVLPPFSLKKNKKKKQPF